MHFLVNPKEPFIYMFLIFGIGFSIIFSSIFKTCREVEILKEENFIKLKMEQSQQHIDQVRQYCLDTKDCSAYESLILKGGV